MRYFARDLFAILVFSGTSILAHGQFQEPTAEELHMTSDPKAPGASAVYLYLEEKTDDAYHYHSYYARINSMTTLQLFRLTGKRSTWIRGRECALLAFCIGSTSLPRDFV